MPDFSSTITWQHLNSNWISVLAYCSHHGRIHGMHEEEGAGWECTETDKLHGPYICSHIAIAVECLNAIIIM